jgi:hypothetical protein
VEINMTKEERIKLYAALAAPFPDEAVERTRGAVTGRGYDSVGLKYQFVVDRLNEVLGIGGFRTNRTIVLKAVTTAKGRPAYEAIAEVRLELGEWIDGVFITIAEAWGDGGHTAMSEADARKGAFTNGFKKAAAFLGPGRDAYRGTIDDDHVPVEQGEPTPARGDFTNAPSEPSARQHQAAPHSERAAHANEPTAAVTTIRNRLSSKQYAALRSLARAAGYDDRGFNDNVRRKYGVEPGYLSRAQASELIDLLMSKANGHAREAG